MTNSSTQNEEFNQIAIQLAQKNASKASIINYLIEKGCLGGTAGLLAEQVKKQVHTIVRTEAAFGLMWSAIAVVVGIIAAALFGEANQSSSPDAILIILVIVFGILALLGAVFGIVAIVFLITGKVPAKYEVYSFHSRVFKKIAVMEAILPVASAAPVREAAPVAPVKQVAPMEASVEEAAPEVVPPSEKQPSAELPPTGIGGWLSFFCFSLTVLTPIIFIGTFLDSTVDEIHPNIILANGVIFCAIAAYSLLTGVRVWMRRPDAIKQARIYLIVSLVLGILSLVYYAANTQASDAATTNGITQFVRSAGYFLIWWFYLARSKRVRNTFPPAMK